MKTLPKIIRREGEYPNYPKRAEHLVATFGNFMAVPDPESGEERQVIDYAPDLQPTPGGLQWGQ